VLQAGWFFPAVEERSAAMPPSALIAPPSERTEELFFDFHRSLGFLLALFVALHVAGALKRHFVLRDMTLRRMWF